MKTGPSASSASRSLRAGGSAGVGNQRVGDKRHNTRNGVGYLIMDVERSVSRNIGKQIESLDSNIRTRLLF